MSWQETRNEYCYKHNVHYTVTYTFSGASNLVGNPSYPNAGSLIRSEGGCPKCKTESEFERLEYYRKERKEALQALPKKSFAKSLKLALKLGIIFFFLGPIIGIYTVPDTIVNQTDPMPYFGFLLSRTIYGFFRGFVAGAVIGFISYLIEKDRLKKSRII